MNTGQMQGQGQQQAQATSNAQQPEIKGLLQAKNITKQNFGFLTDEEITRFQTGVQSFWNVIQAGRTVDPARYDQAVARLRDFTTKLVSRARAQNTSRPAEASNNASTAANVQNNQRAGQSQPPSQQSQISQQAAQAQQPQQNQISQAPEIPLEIMQEAESIDWTPPPQGFTTDEEKQNWRNHTVKRYAQATATLRDSQRKLQKANELIESFRAQGKPVANNLLQSKAQFEANRAKFQTFLEELKKQQQENKAALAASSNASNAASSGSQLATSQTANVNVGASSFTGGPQQQPQQPIRQQQQQTPTSATAPNVSGPPQNTMQNSQTNPVQQQHPQPNTFDQQQVPTPQHPQRPALNTFQPPAYSQTPQQAQHQQPQAHQTQSAGQLQQGSPVPYSHQDAVAAAARSHSNTQGTPQSAYAANTQRPEVEKLNNRQLPISKTLTAPPPQPVSVGAARPTLTGANTGPAGIMGQPAIQKPPTYTLQGPGDRVLDKKKLDELVRQVTGGDAALGGEGLQPEVEESVLQLADEFVDNVVTNACKLAKLRGSGSLEIRDLQLILERHYNIRIPGYATDETRTVRKVQPSPKYLQKMSSVQAAKALGGKTDV